MKVRLSLEKTVKEVEEALHEVNFKSRDTYEPFAWFDGIDKGHIYIIPKEEPAHIFSATWGEKYNGTILERPGNIRYVLLNFREKLCMILVDSIDLNGELRIMPERELFAVAGLYYTDREGIYHVRMLTYIKNDKEVPLIFSTDFLNRWTKLNYSVSEVDKAIERGVEQLEYA